MNMRSGASHIEVIPAGITKREFMKMKTKSTDREVYRNMFDFQFAIDQEL